MTRAALLTRVTRLAWVAAVSWLAGCAGTPPVHAQMETTRRSNVAPPAIEMAAPRIYAAPGSRITLTARTHGGEAMLFSVDWQVVEGPTAGNVAAAGRKDDGSYDAIYTTPAASGTYHVTATIREFPSATTTTEIRVR